jgi:hypothetical protein
MALAYGSAPSSGGYGKMSDAEKAARKAQKQNQSAGGSGKGGTKALDVIVNVGTSLLSMFGVGTGAGPSSAPEQPYAPPPPPPEQKKGGMLDGLQIMTPGMWVILGGLGLAVVGGTAYYATSGSSRRSSRSSRR